MHPSSYENMEKCRDKYLTPAFLEPRAQVKVLDIGGVDLNGSYKPIFSAPGFEYAVADISDAEGVDVVLKDPYYIPLATGSVDVVISGQMLEHCEFFWQSFTEMVRVLKPDGYFFLIAPSSGPEHRFPVDCYRFYPDSYAALAKFAQCQLIEHWVDDREPWHDLVGVFTKAA